MEGRARDSKAVGYFDHLALLARNVAVTLGSSEPTSLDRAVDYVITEARARTAHGNKLMFIGNGGSAAIASHMATDYSKNGRLRALAFNDSAMLTCLANDLGYERAFAFQLENHAQDGDLLIAISSSGKSRSIVDACSVARDRNCFVVTLSGFQPDNDLRRLGDINFYVPAIEYGFVEVMHLAICHCILDFSMNLGVGANAATRDKFEGA
jgi:D-sedoheptulose 7-phosphate isomerase